MKFVQIGNEISFNFFNPVTTANNFDFIFFSFQFKRMEILNNKINEIMTWYFFSYSSLPRHHLQCHIIKMRGGLKKYADF
jgi:hypothetical protein